MWASLPRNRGLAYEKQIACFGVRDYEIPYFEELGKNMIMI